MSGWIKLHRKFTEWEWYDDIPCRLVFLQCLLNANHKEKKYKGKLIRKGQFLTGRKKFAKQVGISVQQVRTAWDKLEDTGELTIESTNQGTTVTVCNYNTYQDLKNLNNQQTNQQLTSNQPATNQQLTTNKNEKNEKNEKNTIEGPPPKFEVPTVSQVEDYFDFKDEMLARDVPLEADKFVTHYEDMGWRKNKGKGDRIDNWHRQAGTWINNYKRYNENRLHEKTKPVDQARRAAERTKRIFGDSENA